MDISTSSSEPSSMLHVRASTMYPLPTPAPGDLEQSGDVSMDATDSGAMFPLLCGEARLHTGRCVDGALAVTNYRLYLQNGARQVHVPLGLIEQVEVRDMFYLHIGCKDARSYRCTFESNEQCAEWFRRLSAATAPARHLPDMFAFCFRAWAEEREHEEVMRRLGPAFHAAGLDGDDTGDDTGDADFRSEVERLGFDLHGAWRVSQANTRFRLCGSYPPLLLVPACISDDTLETVARFRSSRRIPAVVWRHAGNGAVIARCSQPEVGWLGWRSSEDEDLLKAIADACAYDKGPRSILDGGTSAPHTPTTDQLQPADGDLVGGAVASGHTTLIDAAQLQGGKKVLIMDARSYTTAVANRARGGGCECPEYYPSCDIQFMNLANIHSIRKSFHALRQLCASSADQPNWWSLLEGTRWLQHMSGLMRAAATLAAAVERDARPALVHCSDGWDRTPQIVALAELLLDPYYRTMDGFRVLVEREWLAFGHKFADRCGHAAGSDDQNERCPVFLQWLDCVHQLLEQFPCSFQFANTYLVKLAQHTYSNLFGTFLCNTKQERVEHVYDKTFSVWRYLNASVFRNHLYAPCTSSVNQVLWPACNVRDLKLWSDVYIGSLESSSSDGGECAAGLGGLVQQPGPGATVGAVGAGCPCLTRTGAAPAGCQPGVGAASAAAMTKTRSYGDLMGVMEPCGTIVRRSSDPNLVIDPMKISSLSINSAERDQNESLDNSVPNDQTVLQNGYTVKTPNSLTNGETPVQEITQNGFSINGDEHITLDADKTELTNGFKPPKDSLDSTESGFCKNYTNKIDQEYQINENYPKNIAEIENNWMKGEFANEFLINYDFKPKIVGEQGFFGLADINHNGEISCPEPVKCADDDSDNDKSESKSEVTLCPSPKVVAVCKSAKSNETSTDTLVAENGVIASVDQVDAVERTEPVQNGASDGCEVCAQNRKLIGDKHFQHSRSTSGKTSRYSTPPPYSRTSSAGGGGGGGLAGGGGGTATHCYYAPSAAACGGLDVDGLIPLRSDVQYRLWQIQEEHRIKEEALQRELHTTRMALIKQVCHNCSYNDADRPDDTGSLVGSVCSTGDGPASVGDSLPSDLSWEALDDGPGSLLDGATAVCGPAGVPRTLWVPDHAVSRCTGCHTEFWLGRRKHHCRNCGRIFCADCSENSTPLPSEHLYNPVRVCTSCYVQLRRACPSSLPDKCKHAHHVTSAAATAQLTATSN